MDEIIAQLAKRVEDLAFDYERMSQSGKDAFNEICSLLAQLSQ